MFKELITILETDGKKYRVYDDGDSTQVIFNATSKISLTNTGKLYVLGDCITDMKTFAKYKQTIRLI